MIIVTVGTQLPFDRLIRAVDRIAPEIGLTIQAQIGEGEYIPQNIAWARWYNAVEFNSLASQSSLIVAHAGIGSVLMAERHCKPLVLFPRRCDMGEHRNDHQLATAKVLAERPGVSIAYDETQLHDYILAAPGNAVEAAKSDERTQFLVTLEQYLMGISKP